MEFYLSNDECYLIKHSRTKGSRNGVRRYQNPDGTWTQEGLARRRSEYAHESGGNHHNNNSTNNNKHDNNKHDNNKHNNNNNNKGNNNGNQNGGTLKKVQNTLNSTRTFANELGKASVSNKRQNYTNFGMSDIDLQNSIRRMELENRYNQLKSEQVNRGKISFNDAMNKFGQILTVGAAGVGVALSVRELINGIKKDRNKNKNNSNNKDSKTNTVVPPLNTSNTNNTHTTTIKVVIPDKEPSLGQKLKNVVTGHKKKNYFGSNIDRSLYNLKNTPNAWKRR